MRIAVLFHRIGPYHHARLNGLAGHADVVAIEGSHVDPFYAWSPLAAGHRLYRCITLFEDVDVTGLPRGEVRRRVRSALEQARPDAVAVNGWSDPRAIMALRWCVERDVPAIMMSDSTHGDDDRRPWLEAIKRIVLRNCPAGLAAGTRHRAYLTGLGLDRVSLGYDAVDNAYFAQAAARARAEGAGLRDAHGLPERYFLATGRFVPEKNFATLVHAFAGFLGEGRPTDPHLVLAGSGPEEAALRGLVERLGLADRVLFPGFVQYDALPIHYAFASAFFLPSRSEPWGLVVNEAMASGLPVFVSRQCGCAPDLVVEGVNGFTFDAGAPEEIAAHMRAAAAGAYDLDAMGRESARIVADWGVERFARGMVAAGAHARGGHGRRGGGWVDRALLRALEFRQ